MEVRWSGRSLADLETIQDYLLERNPLAAIRLVDVLRSAGDTLATMPHRGRPGRWPGTRELIVPDTPYLLPYRIRGEAVEILHVFHGARRWPSVPEA
jgi:toxin ParE1/3/4